MYLLGYDIGSSSVKAALVNAETGSCVASGFFPSTEAPIKALKPGWAEQNPADWWTYLSEATHSVIKKSGINPADIKAIGISYQMHGLVMLDKNMHPLRDAIIWCDSRGVPYGQTASNALGHDTCLHRLLNLPGNFTATKLAWIKEHEPETFEKIAKIALPGDYIAYLLTNRICTTVSGLSEMMLWDFTADAPAGFLMDHFGYSADILPDIVPTFGIQGQLTLNAAKDLGLEAGIPVTYRAGDQPNNALSLNVFNPGEIAATAGTSGVIYGINGNTSYDEKSRINNFAHVNHTPNNVRIGVLACINGTGILNTWIKRNIAPEGISYDNMNAMAAKIPVGSLGVTILPFGNGAERMLCNRQTGCSIHGISFNSNNRECLLRAAQEGIVFAFMYGIEIMQNMGLPINTIHAGNANMFMSPVFRRTLASVSGATIRLIDTDGAAGAAKGAGIGAGIYSGHDEAFASLHCIEEVYPDTNRQPYIEAYARWKQILNDTLSVRAMLNESK